MTTYYFRESAVLPGSTMMPYLSLIQSVLCVRHKVRFLCVEQQVEDVARIDLKVIMQGKHIKYGVQE